MIYGYARISSKFQNIDRQVRNIKAVYPDARMIIEVYTGRMQDRPKWVRFLPTLKPHDKVVFDSVSRMSRTSDEGFADYKELYQRDVELEFLNEPQINTAVYREALQVSIPMTGTDADLILRGVEQYLMKLAEKQIKIAFDQAQKEVDDLRQRTIEGLETARLSGKQLGRPRGRYITEKERKAKNIILKRDTLFGGDLRPSDCMKVIGISRSTYYKYRNDLFKKEA